MKRTAPYLSWSLLLCAVLVAGGQFLASAQRPEEESAPAAKSPVAVIDVSKVFKEHNGFREKIEQMKVNVAAAEQGLRNERDKIKELADELKATESAELKTKLEAEIAERQLRLKLKVDLQKKDFMNQEAVIYAKVYNAVETAVASYSRQRGIAIVMRYNDLKIDETSQREAILSGVNRAVVFQDDVDITDEIIKRLNSPVEGGNL